MYFMYRYVLCIRDGVWENLSNGMPLSRGYRGSTIRNRVVGPSGMQY